MKLLLNKPAIFFLCLMALYVTVSAQNIGFKEIRHRKFAIVGDSYVDTTGATPQKMAFYNKCVRLNKLKQEHFYFNWLGKENIGIRFDTASKSKIYEGLKQTNNGQEFTSVLIDGKTSVEIIAQNIDDEVKGFNYLYRVIKNNNQELVSWTPIMSYRSSADKSVIYAYLGKFDYSPGEFLKLEMYNTKNFTEQDAVLIDWRKVEPARVDANLQYYRPKYPLLDNEPMLMPHNLTELRRTTDRHVYYINKKIVFKNVPYSDMIQTTDPKDPKFYMSDTIQNINFDIANGGRAYNYKVSLKRGINGKTDSLQLGETNSQFVLYKDFWKAPGKYVVTFTPKIRNPGGSKIELLHKLATNIKFTVLPPLDNQRTVSLKTLGYIIIILLTTAGFMFAMYRSGQKRKINKEAQNRQIATLQLQSVRAQLNPHFIFNALAGIQNLMNKNEIENANKYLSKFARLTRNVLDDANNELTSIEHETDLLNDYLLMEQMRFGFKFTIEVDEKEIDQQIEIPAMLLQPFAENAVKHGVSALGDKGEIKVAIARVDNTIALHIKDNGKGFNGNATNGMGIKLCEDRIKLLNSIYKNTNIVLHKTSNNNGTLITIELQNWL